MHQWEVRRVRVEGRSGEVIQDSDTPNEPDPQFWWASGSGPEQGRPFGSLVSPRAEEAFGGALNTNKAILRLLDEFNANDTDIEQCGIIGVAGQGNHAFRLWTDRGSADEITVPVAEIVSIISADKEAFGYGWVFAHTHSMKREPSKNDNTATCALAWIGKILDIPLVDHWIYSLNNPGFYAYSKMGRRYLEPSISFEIDEDG